MFHQDGMIARPLFGPIYAGLEPVVRKQVKSYSQVKFQPRVSYVARK